MPPTRRQFLTTTAIHGGALATSSHRLAGQTTGAAHAASGPWWKRCVRWGQTNITELDPTYYDIDWWRTHWRNTRVQGVVINGGGITAYYPTEVPFHHKADYLGHRDLFGELLQAAHDDGIAVFTRMDSNRTGREAYDAHPDWFAHDMDGNPYMNTGLYIACVNSPYYHEHLPAVLREIATRYRPEGFTDNNWNGPMRHMPCYCRHCQSSFQKRRGESIPTQVDWNSEVYRDWIMWNYERRLEIWDTFNAVTREAGGPDCVYVGMMAGSQNWQSRVFRDDREVYRRTEIIMLDDQRRHDSQGFMHNGEIGKRLRAVGGWDKVIPESMAMYHLGGHNFRLATKPVPEVRMWAVEGFAGGVQPWWHHLGADQHDRRMLQTARPLMEWHERNEEFLLNRRPLDTVGLLWSQRNMDFFGRDDAGSHVSDPWNGFGQAMVRGRIPYIPIHADDIDREATERGLKLLILPNLAGLSDEQVSAIRRFVEQGGNLLATGLSSLCNEWGDVREDFALADLFGVRLPTDHPFRDEAQRRDWAQNWRQTYLRLTPELRGEVYGPLPGIKPANTDGERHAILAGLDQTDLLPFGGRLAPLHVDDPKATIPFTYVPPLPTSPPEHIYMREAATDIPGLVMRELANGSRIAYLPADLDRQFSSDNNPDVGDVLANLIRWTAQDDLPITVEGPGLVDVHVWHQPGRVIVHFINLTSAGTWRTPVHELIPVGPHKLTVRLPADVAGTTLQPLTDGQFSSLTRDGNHVTFEIAATSDHNVAVIS